MSSQSGYSNNKSHNKIYNEDDEKFVNNGCRKETEVCLEAYSNMLTTKDDSDEEYSDLNAKNGSDKGYSDHNDDLREEYSDYKDYLDEEGNYIDSEDDDPLYYGVSEYVICGDYFKDGKLIDTGVYTGEQPTKNDVHKKKVPAWLEEQSDKKLSLEPNVNEDYKPLSMPVKSELDHLPLQRSL
jgi:hypothetical protein